MFYTVQTTHNTMWLIVIVNDDINACTFLQLLQTFTGFCNILKFILFEQTVLNRSNYKLLMK